MKMRLDGKGKYKICLEVKLIGNSKVSIELLYIDDTAITLTKDKDFNIHRNSLNGFCIWSNDSFCFGDKHLRLPDELHVKPFMYHVHDYKTDYKRKIGLKKLYNALQTYSCDKKIFINNYGSIKQNNIDVYDNNWFIY